MANIYQAGGKAIGKAGRKIMEAVEKKKASAEQPVWTSGEAKYSSPIAEQLSAKRGEAQIEADISSDDKALSVFHKLREQGIPIYKDTFINVKKEAESNPRLSIDELYKAEAERALPTTGAELIQPAEIKLLPPGKLQEIEAEVITPSLPAPPGKDVTVSGTVETAADRYRADQARRAAAKEAFKESQPPKEEGPIAPPPSSFTTARKVGAGMVAAGAVGKALGGGEEKDEEKPLPVYNVNPRITEEGKLEPSPAELDAANSRGGYKAVRQLWNTYEDLNRQVEERPLVGSRSDVNIKVQRAQDYLSELRAMATPETKQAAVPSRPLVLAPEEPVVPATKATVTERIKEKKAATPTPPSGGKATREVATSDSAVQNAISQAKIGTSVQDDVSALEQKLSAGQNITRGELLGIVKKMEGLKPDQVAADPGLLNELKAAREDARRAYKEQVTRNEWSEVAQTIANAVAKFVAAQQGVADRALSLPNVDYNARTQQALREYQTELGSLGEQRKELERDVERRQSAAEKEAALQQRSYDRLLQLGEQQISAQERKAEKERDYRLQLQLNSIKEKKAAQAEEKAAKKEEAKAKSAGTEQYLSALTKDIQQTDSRIKELQRKQATAAAVVNSESKDFDKNFNEYAASRGVTKEEPTFQKKGWWGSPSFDKETARKAAAVDLIRVKQELDALRQKKATREQEQQSILTGGQQAVKAAPAAQPTGQQPATSGKVLSESDLEAYAKSQGTTPAAARNFLISQGYTIQGK